ncbi:hypothetical protein M0R45_036443 [Rubus argutus]|uniref:Uncharacterized protein n=1 Tax=Rubus argutus TaxID=59490 RepID=A0AAW1VXK2_RUBAR
MLVPWPRVYLSACLCLQGTTEYSRVLADKSIFELGFEHLNIHVGAEEVVLGAELIEDGGLALEQILEQIQSSRIRKYTSDWARQIVGDSAHQSSASDLVLLFAMFFLFYLLLVTVSTSTTTT